MIYNIAMTKLKKIFYSFTHLGTETIQYSVPVHASLHLYQLQQSPAYN